MLQAAQKLEAGSVYCGHGTDNTWDEACLLLLHAMGLERAEESILNQQLSDSDQQSFDFLIDRRIKERIPAAYLVGEAEFAGLRFIVDKRVLVPRSPIAELIHNRFRPWINSDPDHILDLCTGSGCIGIATATAFSQANVTLSDLSDEALEVAELNVAKHCLGNRCEVIQSDLFTNLAARKFDLILSNPPYVDQRDIDDMPAEYHAEPMLGLAAGQDGLDLVGPLLAEAAEHLNEGGHLIVEVGNSWAALEDRYAKVPFTWIEFEYGGDGVFILSKEELVEFGHALH